MEWRAACRGLLRAPGFSALVILTLAIGIGTTTTMFSVVWAVLLRPLAFPQPERLVTLWESDARGGEGQRRVTPANFVDWRARTRSFEAVGVLPNWIGVAWPFNVVTRDGLERVHGIYASSGFFRAIGVAPQLGSTFADDADRAPIRQVVISHAYWQSRFGGAPSIIGRPLEIDTFRGGAFTIIGVMPEGFEMPRGAQLWLSLADWGAGPMPAPDAVERCCSWYAVFGRLKADVSIERASAELTAIARDVSARHPDASAVTQVRVIPLRDTLVGSYKLTLVGLLGAVACVLLIGCANVANLLLSRGVSRRREVLTRLALGATRWRIARQLLGESLLLGGVGAMLGLLIAIWAQRAIAAAMAERVPLIESTRLDWTVLAFSIAVSVIVSIVCGLAPLVEWRRAEWTARAHTEGRASRRVRHALVVGEVALAVALVSSAGLLLRTVVNLRAVDVGFEANRTPGRTLVMATDLTTAPLRSRGNAARFLETLMPRLAALPGVRAVAATTGVPLEGGPASQPITREGEEPRNAAESPQAVSTAVTPGYFTAMGIALLRGRVFTEDDRADGQLVAILNETAARRLWPGADPIGKRFVLGSRERLGSFRAVRLGEKEWREVVGVVRDVRSAGFASPVLPEIYYSYKQYPIYDPSLIVRTDDDVASTAGAVRREVTAVNARALVTRVRTPEDVADQSIADPRVRATLAAIFSSVALVLGMLGIYGVLAYTVARETRDIGIRMALGAQRTHIARAVIGRALRLTTAGVALGLIAAYLVARSLSTLFFGVGATDIVTLVATCALLLASALVAAAWPTHRATRIEPAVAVRDE